MLRIALILPHRPPADTGEQEAEIERLLHGLYGLITQETRIIEHHAR